jgi:hypothetical protein
MSGRGSLIQNDEDGAGIGAMVLSIVTIRTVREPEPVCQSRRTKRGLMNHFNRSGMDPCVGKWFLTLLLPERPFSPSKKDSLHIFSDAD